MITAGVNKPMKVRITRSAIGEYMARLRRSGGVRGIGLLANSGISIGDDMARL